jgi:hypothetical protein
VLICTRYDDDPHALSKGRFKLLLPLIPARCWALLPTVRRRLAFFTLILLLAAGWTAWFMREPIRHAFERLAGHPIAAPQRPTPRPEDYRALIEDARRWRNDLADRYRRADDNPQRDRVLTETRRFLETLLPEMMRCWLGTPWDFNGTASTPGDGRIACGYFVSTVLRDSGFQVDRYQLAQQASENILLTFLPSRELLRRVGVPYESFAAEVRSLEDGVYIVGLDTHVAFLVVDDGSFRFIHSSGSRPWCVVDEGESEASVLQASNTRLLGNLTTNRRVLTRWLLGERLAVRGAR